MSLMKCGAIFVQLLAAVHADDFLPAAKETDAPARQLRWNACMPREPDMVPLPSCRECTCLVPGPSYPNDDGPCTEWEWESAAHCAYTPPPGSCTPNQKFDVLKDCRVCMCPASGDRADIDHCTRIPPYVCTRELECDDGLTDCYDYDYTVYYYYSPRRLESGREM
eukprot:TRINITY_DN4217_c0_g1_i1.p3 TRINITY_DN4217_c0_g1~~TRINITY_DN4217_c0_g1_i1.p3  ORF type:complete len:186 (+),score=14.10 TRINITY_DN4217_c0_g1_i1:62-559(+)